MICPGPQQNASSMREQTAAASTAKRANPTQAKRSILSISILMVEISLIISLSCANCNLHKAKATQSVDLLTKVMVSLYHPRLQDWNDHFVWDKSGVYIEGLSDVGHATIERLKMNDAKIVFARGCWVSGGYHPPK